jgi:hypothetical protein
MTQNTQQFPDLEASAKTQNAGTVGTYRKAVAYFEEYFRSHPEELEYSEVLDYGAGLGLGADEMRPHFDRVSTFEPFARRWKGSVPCDYSSASAIPDETFEGVVCFSVLNVVPSFFRRQIVHTIGRALKVGGVALISARTPSDVASAKLKTAVPHVEPHAYLIGEGSETRYQKGFRQAELEALVSGILGDAFEVTRTKAVNGAAVAVRRVK